MRQSTAWWKTGQNGVRLAGDNKGKGYSTEFVEFKISTEDGQVSRETKDAAKKILDACQLRDNYQDLNKRQTDYEMPDPPFCDTFPEKSKVTCHSVDGVFLPYLDGKPTCSVIDMDKFYDNYASIISLMSDGPVKTLSYKRLRLLHCKFKLHVLLNASREVDATQDDPRDFSTVVKVDTHIHLAAAMTAKHLLDFIKHRISSEEDKKKPVFKTKQGEWLTLQQLCDKIKLDTQSFTLESLDVHADTTFQRFDIFNNKYNPFGSTELRDVFLKPNNHTDGEYMAQITKELFTKLENSKYHMAEYRISVYGRSMQDWSDVAKWIVKHKLYCKHQRWLVQIPRLYFLYRELNTVKSFQEMLDNLFKPLFEATIDPASHPEIYQFLHQVSGFDCVDDESRPESEFTDRESTILPEEWTSKDNPNYAYYLYYIWANLTSLNHLRKSRGMRAIELRPHCGESGALSHLAAGFLLAHNINHGIRLSDCTPLQYLFYLKQIGLAVSPLSNNRLFVKYKNNPFKKFFLRGLNVSLSTDDPLQFHYTENPLLEEYAIAAQHWELTTTDLSEIAANSVRQSGFEHKYKKMWLGNNYFRGGVEGNDVSYSNIPNIRVAYRVSCLQNEMGILHKWMNFSSLVNSQMVSESAFQDPNLVHDYARFEIFYPSNERPESDPGTKEALKLFAKALSYRSKYVKPIKTTRLSNDSHHVFALKDGVFQVKEALKFGNVDFIASSPIIEPVSFVEWMKDFKDIMKIVSDTNTRLFSIHKLKYLSHLFNVHMQLNGRREKALLQGHTKTDIYHIAKCDNNPKLNSFMNANQLLVFMKEQIAKDPKRVVSVTEEGLESTLSDVLDLFGVPLNHLTLDLLDVKAGEPLMHYDHLGEFSSSNASDKNLIKEVFLDYDNYIDGEFLSALLKKTLEEKKKIPQQIHEVVVSITGKSPSEWGKLAKWIYKNQIASDQISFLVEIPYCYAQIIEESSKNDTYRLQNFSDLLDNIFRPLFEASEDPEKHPEIAFFLDHMSGFTTAENTSNSSSSIDRDVTPNNWHYHQNPSSSYYTFYLWSNIRSLNALRNHRGNTHEFIFRPAATNRNVESGVAGFLSADSVTSGLSLKKSSVLQYLYYLKQVGVIMSPLYANSFRIEYFKNPFPEFFSKGVKGFTRYRTTSSISYDRRRFGRRIRISTTDVEILSL
eukprot:TRINITY_DN1168_c0_g1_i2.p1 TRINITY_DN1168_c0_g1~~TRINITY_DN1168_c0_g1_i2.p1  ORF type:complete len:1179 (+),score=208.21 TRINITY_DN1168_c0_g1_i2:720-4256(+)